ncbi:MAG: hypothetical protein Q8S84_01775 [bacterium]|nr:hypothetical protein [bacterium]
MALSFRVFGLSIFHFVNPINSSSQNTMSSNKSNTELINEIDNLSLDFIFSEIVSYNEIFFITSFFFFRIFNASLCT